MSAPDTTRRLPIPIRAAAPETSACEGAESFALMVLGDSMAPEFEERDIVVIEPAGLAVDGSYVLAFWDDEWIFRRLRHLDVGWQLVAVNPDYPQIAIPDLSPVRGVIIQKSKPGRRRAAKRYVQ